MGVDVMTRMARIHRQQGLAHLLHRGCVTQAIRAERAAMS
jgi:hypothetical protein